MNGNWSLYDIYVMHHHANLASQMLNQMHS